jgi:hypothetical protein
MAANQCVNDLLKLLFKEYKTAKPKTISKQLKKSGSIDLS